MEEDYEDKGISSKEAGRRAWATNKWEDGSKKKKTPKRS
jgi:hypothetical protein